MVGIKVRLMFWLEKYVINLERYVINLEKYVINLEKYVINLLFQVASYY